MQLPNKMFIFIENIVGLSLTTFVIFFMMLIVAFDILSRKILGIFFPTTVDVVSLVMLIVAFCSLVEVQRKEEHLKVDFLTLKFEGTKIGASIKLVENIIIFFTNLILFYCATEVFKYVVKFNVQTMGARIPKWIVVIFMPIAFSLLTIRGLIQIKTYLLQNKAQTK